jgi:putative endonuclease
MTDPRFNHFVYVLRCADGTLYTGYTTDVERRVREHDAGDGAKYTRGRTPVACCHVESFDSKSAAMAREYELKQHTRAEKETVVADSGIPDWLDLPEELVADA